MRFYVSGVWLFVASFATSFAGTAAEANIGLYLEQISTSRRGKNVPACSSYSTAATTLLHRIPRGGACLPLREIVTAGSLGAFGLVQVINPKSVLLPSRSNSDKSSSSLVTSTTHSALMQGAGAMPIGTAIMLFCSTFDSISPQMAVGLGLLPRLLYFIIFVWKFRRTKVMIATTAMTLGCTTSLLKGTKTAALSCKIFSTFALVKGLFMALAPKAALGKFLEEEVDDEQTLALTRVLGCEATMSGVLMVGLSYGIDKMIAAGFSLLAYPLLVGVEALQGKTWKSRFDGEKAVIVARIIFVSMFLLPGYL